MLSARNLGYRVGSATLLAEFGATFAPGTLALLVGPNGAGKSTCVKLLCGELPPTAGEVELHGRPLADWGDTELARTRAVLSQDVELAFPLRCWEVVMMGRYPHFVGQPAASDDTACEAAMRQFDVWELADRDYLTLSGGERQRVQFARVFAQIWTPDDEARGAARCLVLDEPLTFLDVRYQFDFMRTIRGLIARDGLIVVGVVHDLNLAARFGDQVLLLHHGRLLASGAPAEVLTPDLVETAFGIRPTVYRSDSGVHLLFE